MSKRFFDFDEVERRDAYKLLTGLIVPRPIGWIGTKRADGSNNLAPFSFFNVVAASPPTVVFSGGRHPDRPKDSVALAQESGAFSVNIVSTGVVEAMNATAATFDAETDEFAETGLTAVPGTVVDVPLVAESPANLECRVVGVVPLGDAGWSRLVIGEVVAVHVESEIVDGTRIDHDLLGAIGRMAGSGYVRTTDTFEVDRPA